MKTIKILCLMLVALMLGVCFTGCDGNGEETTTDEQPAAPEQTDAPEQTTDATTEEETTAPEAPEELQAYDAFYLNTYMKPIWKGKYMYNETVMFVGMDDKASLLYTPDEILSVTSYDLQTVYEQGKDYDVVDGQIVLLEGTRIPVITIEEYYHNQPSGNAAIPDLMTKYNGKNCYTYWGEGTTMTQWQIAVTYTHSQTWEGFVPETSDQFTQLIGKLEVGEDVTMIFYGDSITWGASASGLANTQPYMPTYTQLFTQYLAQKYGYTVKYVNPGLAGTAVPPAEDSVFGTNGTITYINPAVGGWTSADGTNKFDEYVKPFVDEYGCDFFLLAFGMNDAGNSAKSEKKAIKKIADQLYDIAPDADMLLVATMIPNPDATNGWYGNQHKFETVFEDLAADYVADGKSCAVAKMTSMSQRIIENKRFRDHTGNNINHPNDFLARIYAQVVYQTVIGY